MHSTFALMRVAYRLGDWDRVEACLEDHLANFALETGVRCINVQMGPSEGALVLAHRGDTQRALELARLPFPFERIVGPIEGAQAGALVAAGAVDEGFDLAERFDTQLAVFDAARTRELLADVVPASEARGLLETAKAVYERLRATPHLRRVDERLAAL